MLSRYSNDRLHPFVMSWSGAHLCSPGLTCSMSKSDGAKESCDCSWLMSLCGCIVVLQQPFPVSLEFCKKNPQAPLVLIFHYPLWWAKVLLKEAMVSSSYFIKNMGRCVMCNLSLHGSWFQIPIPNHHLNVLEGLVDRVPHLLLCPFRAGFRYPRWYESSLTTV